MAMGETPSWFVVSRSTSPLEWVLDMAGGGLTRERAVASFVSSACINVVLPLCCVAGQKLQHC